MKIARGMLVTLAMIGCGGNPETTSGSSSGSGGGAASGSSSSGSGGGGGSVQQPLDPEIIEMVGQVSAPNLTNSITKLSSITTRNLCSDNSPGSDAIGGARDWIQAQFTAIGGLTVKLDPFTYNNCAPMTITRENVVAWKLGSGHPERLIVIGGHYDSRTLNVYDGISAAPGANDSGSQTSLVLEAARVMSKYTFDATVVFIAFAGEEQGLVGSRAFSVGYGKYFAAGATVEAMFNNDIVGGDNSVNDATTLQQFRLYSPGTPREIAGPEGTTDDTSPSRGMMRQIASAGGAYMPSMTIVPKLREDRPMRGSDHEAFIEQTYPAVRFIETVESPNAGTVQSHQHSPNDLLMYVTPDYAARITQVVIASAASLARAPAPPAMINVTGSATGPVTVGWAAPKSGVAVDHYVVAGRATTENFYHTRVSVPASATSRDVTAADLGISGAPAFFVSVAAVDADGHESLFAYPEYRCDSAGCAVQAGSLNLTATK